MAETNSYRIKIKPSADSSADPVYETDLPETLLPYFRTWNNFVNLAKGFNDDDADVDRTLIAPRDCTGGEAYFKAMLEFAEWCRTEDFPANRKIPLNPDEANDYDQKDFTPTEWETQFFNRIRELPADQEILRKMLGEDLANHQPHPQDSVLCLYYAANYHAFLELLEACAKNTALQMQNLSHEELEQMFHDNNNQEAQNIS